MSILYYINVSAHLLAALLWLGGMFFLAVVGAPVLRHIEPAKRARRTAAWLARLNAIAGLVVVLAAVRLARGG